MWVIIIQNIETSEYIGYYTNKKGRIYSYSNRAAAEEHLSWSLKHKNNFRLLKANEKLVVEKIEGNDLYDRK